MQRMVMHRILVRFKGLDDKRISIKYNDRKSTKTKWQDNNPNNPPKTQT